MLHCRKALPVLLSCVALLKLSSGSEHAILQMLPMQANLHGQGVSCSLRGLRGGGVVAFTEVEDDEQASSQKEGSLSENADARASSSHSPDSVDASTSSLSPTPSSRLSSHRHAAAPRSARQAGSPQRRRAAEEARECEDDYDSEEDEDYVGSEDAADGSSSRGSSSWSRGKKREHASSFSLSPPPSPRPASPRHPAPPRSARQAAGSPQRRREAEEARQWEDDYDSEDDEDYVGSPKP